MSDQQYENLFGVEIEIDDAVAGSDFPTFQWMHGDPKLKKLKGPGYTGAIFIAADQGLPPDRLPEGFEPFTLTTQKNEEIPGFACRQITFAPITRRASWVVRRDQGLNRRFGFNSYDEAKAFNKGREPGSRVHILMDPNIGEPCVLSLGGMAAARMTSRNQGGILPAHSLKVVRAAHRMARRMKIGGVTSTVFPNCMFELTLGASRDDKGDPVFEQVGSDPERQSTIVYPQWLDAPTEALDFDALMKRHVGNERFAQNQKWWKEAQEWRERWGDLQLEEAFAALEGHRGADTNRQLEDKKGGAPAEDDYGF